MTYVASALIVIGAAFCALASLGILRFPDVYTRLHAASKAGPLGAGLILLAVALASGDLATAVRGVLGCAFLTLTVPLSGHLLARAALRAGTPLASITSINDQRGNG
ncbi:MAG: monovalent cation/H(+) antiporter subunit G [Devosia nanyangense]|uniref:Monovalent cation/H(+) antiporter subunit G n=1 Tax=Devosia nanyangense TaxID=1228055 RepID=A0A933L6F6_9HYPH|nr:monovalent cation/H(+) antiporter subunit G [Devosia nanyangense]